MLITVSGIDGAGKTTQIGQLLEYFNGNGIKAVRLWSRGGYTPVYSYTKKIIRMLLGKKLPPPGKTEKREKMLNSKKVSTAWLIIAIFDLILYYAIYMRFVMHIQKKVIIADRYLIDTLIDFRINFSNISINRWLLWKLLVCIAPKPDNAFLLLITLDEAKKRADLKKEAFADLPKIRNIRYRYYTRLNIKNSERINCMRNVDEVRMMLINSIEKKKA